MDGIGIDPDLNPPPAREAYFPNTLVGELAEIELDEPYSPNPILPTVGKGALKSFQRCLDHRRFDAAA